MRVIGIDPGKSGGIASLGETYYNSAIKMPETVGDLVDHLRSLAALGYVTAFVENVHSSPQMGVVSAFTFGRGVGNIEAACQAVGIGLHWIAPGKWQRELGCLSKGDKNVTKRRAQELFPGATVTHRIADALLIGEYGRRALSGRVS